MLVRHKEITCGRLLNAQVCYSFVSAPGTLCTMCTKTAGFAWPAWISPVFDAHAVACTCAGNRFNCIGIELREWCVDRSNEAAAEAGLAVRACACALVSSYTLLFQFEVMHMRRNNAASLLTPSTPTTTTHPPAHTQTDPCRILSSTYQLQGTIL